MGSHLIDMALFGGILFVLIPEILKQLRVPLEWSSIAFGILGIQALTTNTNLGSTSARRSSAVDARPSGSALPRAT